MRFFLRAMALLFFFAAEAAADYTAPAARGIAMHGLPRYGWNFKSFDYVNPNAPKGGTLKMAAFGTFDTFNPYVIRGAAAAGASMIYDTLTVESADEPFSEYGLIAETIEMPKDRSWVAFNLNKKARFSDGRPVTAEDVVFSFNILREKGLPMFRYYYGGVREVIAERANRVVFVFNPGDNRELPLILGQMPVLPKHYWEDRDFEETVLEPPVGSGAYVIGDFEPGRFVEYERNPDWWAKDLPVTAGQYNFDKIRYDYYRDATVAVEALKAGAYDLRVENEAKKWQSAYRDADLNRGLVKGTFPHGLPSGMQGFVFNTRRPVFADPRVREAVALLFDFEWSNKNLFSGQYTRTKSYFDNSELAAKGVPSSAELELLEPYRDKLPEAVFTTPFSVPETDGTGRIRPQLRQAFALFKQAGWTVKNGTLVNEKDEPFRFEILLDSASSGAWERITLPFVQNLKKAGIVATVRAVDSTQYRNRETAFDYDMIVAIWGQSTSPGNEQRYFWGSEAADAAGSQNYAGIKDPVVDALIEKIVEASDRKKLIAATRALDRVLLYGHYVVPHWYLPVNRLVYRDKFGIPDAQPMKGVQLMTWWADADKEKVLNDIRVRIQKEQNRPTVWERLKEAFR